MGLSEVAIYYYLMLKSDIVEGKKAEEHKCSHLQIKRSVSCATACYLILTGPIGFVNDIILALTKYHTLGSLSLHVSIFNLHYTMKELLLLSQVCRRELSLREIKRGIQQSLEREIYEHKGENYLNPKRFCFWTTD